MIYYKEINTSLNETENVAMAWFNYNNAFDMVLESWIKDCFKIYNIVDRVIKFTMETMKNWITGGTTQLR